MVSNAASMALTVLVLKFAFTTLVLLTFNNVLGAVLLIPTNPFGSIV